ncbi:hypothetical protein SAMN05216251_11267 [Actinacidiphila alni]|uniref:SH3 domain-containing protein n=1 Tax=Actinacidiphila alni TaxID=380248 RepID=A0A1I2I2I4_9ACTN|nr:hypothetical protein [Actinacidiphila alni]SFF35277.1 hypothetical protein SAMN05216251_11267 [Actinacidiphila alni]
MNNATTRSGKSAAPTASRPASWYRRSARAAAAVATIGVLALGAPAATAAGNTYVWDDGASSVPMYFAPNTSASNVKIWMPNGTRFTMNCWLDNAGHRWFYGQEFTHGYWGYVTSGPVRNQTAVGGC